MNRNKHIKLTLRQNLKNITCANTKKMAEEKVKRDVGYSWNKLQITLKLWKNWVNSIYQCHMDPILGRIVCFVTKRVLLGWFWQGQLN